MRDLLEQCVDRGLVSAPFAAAHKASGATRLDAAKLSHFCNQNAERGEFNPPKLATVDAALRRWLEERGVL